MDEEFDEKWFVKQCRDTIKQFQHVPEFTSQLLCKILRMLITALTCFEDAKLVDRQFWRFSGGTSELAWDFQRGPLPQQVHGLFARVRFLPSHYLQTFEEMIQYGFVEGWQASCFGATARPQARFIAHHLESVEMPLTRPPLANQELQRVSDVRQTFIDVRPIPQRPTTATTQATLQNILTMLQQQAQQSRQEPSRRVRKNAHGKRPSDKKDDKGSSSKKRKH